MPDFPHLPLPKKIQSSYKIPRRWIDGSVAELTSRNLANRAAHGLALSKAVDQLSKDWEDNVIRRVIEGKPELPHADIVPVLLHIDSKVFSPEQLYGFGIDVISEVDDGYVIGASIDDFKSLREKIDSFLTTGEKKGKDKAAQLWEIITGTKWRIDYILTDDLKRKWDKIEELAVIKVDITIACALKIPDKPARYKKRMETEQAYEKRYAAWQSRKEKLEAQQLDLEMIRHDEVDEFIQELGGERISEFVSEGDSFCCRIIISGPSLKDFVLNYQYLFDVSEVDDIIDLKDNNEQYFSVPVDVLAPPPNSTSVCIIDSGIEEGHSLLSPAIEYLLSKSYIPGKNSVVDEVANGGHGTKVAGAVLYGNDIPKSGTHQLDIRLYNARILNEDNRLPESLFPPKLMQDVVGDFSGCRIFNLSVNSSVPCNIMHMSHWAAAIDKLMASGDILFVVSAGNISRETYNIRNPGIKNYLRDSQIYPDYLLNYAARISNPSQSCMALTVGSVCNSEFSDQDRRSIGSLDSPSSFTRTGPGLWQMIKPDVVEYGGDCIIENVNNPNISEMPSTSAEVVRSTRGGGNAIGHDIGTSFAAPKVSHIAAKILNIIPNASANLLRTLIVQSARLPLNKFRSPSENDLRYYGYGIPDLTRATSNYEKRITLIGEGTVAPMHAHVFKVAIPESIRAAGNEYDVLIEVTMAFSAMPKRTRRYTKSYLSSWADWQSSKQNESFAQFCSRVTHYVNTEDESIIETEENPIKWSIREDKRYGSVKGFKRQNNSVQKDWIIMKAYEIPEEFSIAVIGHKGWEKDTRKEIPFSLAVSFEVIDTEISVDLYNLMRVENEIELEISY